MKIANDIQRELFERIRQTGVTAHDLAKTLHLGLGAVYKRLKGETQLSLGEIALLSEHYSVALDGLFQPECGKVPFVFKAIHQPIRQFDQYLSTILDLLIWAKRLPGGRLLYSTAEIPIFHYLSFPELFAFKLYMWNRINWEMPEWEDKPFNPELILDNRRLQNLQKSIIAAYNSMPSVEFWPATILTNTLNAIDYCKESGAFIRDDDELLLRKQVQELVQHQKEMAKAGLKFKPGTTPDTLSGAFTLYHNEISLSNITILLEWDSGSMAFVTFDNPNFMYTTEPAFTRYAAEWFYKLRKRSLLISKEGEKHRNRFFYLLNQHAKLREGH